MKTILLFLFVTISVLSSFSQQGIDITVTIKGLNYDTLWFGHTFGKRAVPDFFTTRQSDGKYVFHRDEPIAAGQYALVFKRAANAKYTFISILVPENERKFEVTMDINDAYKSAVFIGSQENTTYLRYLNTIYGLLDTRDSLITEWRMLQDEGNLQALLASEKAILRLQDQIIKSDPQSLSARLIRQVYFNSPVTKGNTVESIAAERQVWFRHHYFDDINITAPDRWRIPLNVEWLDYYTFKLSPPDPDSTILYVDDVLNRLAGDTVIKEYYFNYMVNSFSRMSRFNMDEVFIHLFRNYIEKGKAPWTKEEEKNNMLKDIQRIERVLVGKPAPDITLYDRNGEPFRIYDINSPYTLLVFWNPDCSHCQKELPIISRLYDHFKEKGLKVVATCGKKNDQLPSCWKYIDDNQLPKDWIYLGDGNFQSRFNNLYDLRAFPKLYLLDKNKTILFRRGGESSEEELMLFFDRLIK